MRLGQHPIERRIILVFAKQRLPPDATVQNVVNPSSRSIASRQAASACAGCSGTPSWLYRQQALGHQRCGGTASSLAMLTRRQPAATSGSGEISKSAFDVSGAPRGGLPTRPLADKQGHQSGRLKSAPLWGSDGKNRDRRSDAHGSAVHPPPPCACRFARDDPRRAFHARQLLEACYRPPRQPAGDAR